MTPVGVFDSGLGGLTVLAALRARLPDQPFLYLGDNAHAPYGIRPASEIHALTRAAVARLFARGCRLVILACNTASAVALRSLQEDWLPRESPGARVLGVFVPMIEALAGRGWGDSGPPTPFPPADIALFATPATVASGAFARELGFRARGLRVVSRACTGLVDALESGDRPGAETLAAAHAAALLQEAPAPAAAVLGCTHYPLVAGAFRAALPQETRILSQPDLVAESLSDYLTRHPGFRGQGGGLTLLTTGDPQTVCAAAARFLGEPLAFAAA